MGEQAQDQASQSAQTGDGAHADQPATTAATGDRGKTGGGLLKSGVSASEAGRKGALAQAEARRARRAEQERETAGLTSDEKVILALRKKAEAGDVAAARELREWRRLVEQGEVEEGGDTLTPAQKAAVLDALVAQAAAAHAPAAEDAGSLPA